MKVLIVLIAAAAVFGYYLWDLRRRREASNKTKIIAGIVGITILASIAYGFFLIGSPSTQRAKRFDEQRVNDLTTIQNEVINYWQQKTLLPVSLDNLKNQISGFASPTDPETKQPYGYEVTARLSFKLCATFKTSAMNDRAIQIYPYPQNWNHAAGRVCFDRTIDPQIYKPNTGGTPLPLKY